MGRQLAGPQLSATSKSGRKRHPCFFLLVRLWLQKKFRGALKAAPLVLPWLSSRKIQRMIISMKLFAIRLENAETFIVSAENTEQALKTAGITTQSIARTPTAGNPT
jgi:hypothetical protein